MPAREGYPDFVFALHNSEEIGPRDAEGRLVEIDIDNASHKVQLRRLVLTGLQGEIERTAG